MARLSLKSRRWSSKLEIGGKAPGLLNAGAPMRPSPRRAKGPTDLSWVRLESHFKSCIEQENWCGWWRMVYPRCNEHHDRREKQLQHPVASAAAVKKGGMWECVQWSSTPWLHEAKADWVRATAWIGLTQELNSSTVLSLLHADMPSGELISVRRFTF